MRRITKYAIATVGAAAATFALVSNLSGSPVPTTPVANASTFCEEEPGPRVVTPVPYEISLPPIPSLAELLEDVPCIPLPTAPEPTTPEFELSDFEIPPIEFPELPTLEDLLANIPTEIEVPIPTLPTPDAVADGMVAQ